MTEKFDKFENFCVDLSQCRVLIVDDTPANIDILVRIMSEQGIKISVANSGETALMIAGKASPDLILMDVEMPGGMNGFETCVALKKQPSTANIPLIFVTGLTDQISIKKGFDSGGVDYICKPVQAVEAVARVKTHLSIRKLFEAQQLLIDKFDPESEQNTSATADTSHELRAPLTAIIGYSKVIKKHAKKNQDEKLYQWGEFVLGAGDYLLRLINNMLDLAKSDAGKIVLDQQQFDLATLLRQIELLSIPLAANNKNALIFDYGDATDEIYGDTTRIQQIVVNLISNACKFTQDGTINVTACIDLDTCQITVADTGIGISAEKQQEIFKPYTQAESSTYTNYGGTGLGLTISYRLAKLMGGQISLESSPESGSRFTLTIPLCVSKTI